MPRLAVLSIRAGEIAGKNAEKMQERMQKRCRKKYREPPKLYLSSFQSFLLKKLNHLLKIYKSDRDLSDLIEKSPDLAKIS